MRRYINQSLEISLGGVGVSFSGFFSGGGPLKGGPLKGGPLKGGPL